MIKFRVITTVGNELLDTEKELMMDEVKRTRKVRRDKGRTLYTERDKLVLPWIGEMMVVRLDQLQRLLGRWSSRGEMLSVSGIVGRTAVEQVLGRWRRLKVAQSKKIFAEEPEYVWLTGYGQSAMDLPYRKPWQQNIRSLEHYYWTNEARLYVEEHLGPEAEWLSERRLFVLGENVDGHKIDGLVKFQGQQASIEVELTVKDRDELQRIMNALAHTYDNAWYFTTHKTDKSIRVNISSLSRDLQETFQVINLQKLKEST